MFSFLLLLLVYGLEFGPHIVFERAIRRNMTARAEFKLSGSELARRLLDQHGLTTVEVQELANVSDFGDCYDPVRRVVRLSQKVMHEHTLSAYVVAAHEVGHAIQHANHDGSLQLQRMLLWVVRAAALVLVCGMIFLIIFSDEMGGRETWLWLSRALLGSYLGSAVLLRLVTLPVEWSASFHYAMPMLRQVEALDAYDLEEADKLLFIAATTYIAFAVLSVLVAFLLLGRERQ